MKHYRLIWIDGDRAWLVEEEQTWFRRKRDVVSAGEKLAARFEVKFSGATR